MTTTQLTPAQHAILAKAINTSGGKIEWFPDNIKGGARKKVLDGLFNRALITPDGEGWCVAAEGYDALGMKRPHINPSTFEAKLDAIIANAEAAQDAPDATAAPQTTDAELEADVAACEAVGQERRNGTGQTAHPRQQQAGRSDPDAATPRGRNHRPDLHRHRLAGAHGARHLRRSLQEKLGLTITSDKPQGGERVYRIA